MQKGCRQVGRQMGHALRQIAEKLKKAGFQMGCKEEVGRKAGRGQIIYQNYVDKKKKIMRIVIKKVISLPCKGYM
jgi:hypothetical protein